MTIHGVIARVPYPPKAAIPSRKFVVRYVPEADLRTAAKRLRDLHAQVAMRRRAVLVAAEGKRPQPRRIYR